MSIENTDHQIPARITAGNAEEQAGALRNKLRAQMGDSASAAAAAPAGGDPPNPGGSTDDLSEVVTISKAELEALKLRMANAEKEAQSKDEGYRKMQKLLTPLQMERANLQRELASLKQGNGPTMTPEQIAQSIQVVRETQGDEAADLLEYQMATAQELKQDREEHITAAKVDRSRAISVDLHSKVPDASQIAADPEFWKWAQEESPEYVDALQDFTRFDDPKYPNLAGELLAGIFDGYKDFKSKQTPPQNQTPPPPQQQQQGVPPAIPGQPVPRIPLPSAASRVREAAFNPVDQSGQVRMPSMQQLDRLQTATHRGGAEAAVDLRNGLSQVLREAMKGAGSGDQGGGGYPSN